MAGTGKKEASPEALEKLKSFNEEQADWWGTCRVCGRKVTGKLQDMRCDHGVSVSEADTPDPAVD